VPGLGVSVTRDYGLALRRWDEAARPEVTRETKQSLGDKIVSMFNLRRRNTVKENAQEKSGASVRRSQSMVTQSRKKQGPDDKNVVRRIRSQQQQQQPQQHKTLTKVNSGPGSPCETYMGSDKQLYCDKNLQQIQNISRQSFNPYVCHSCLRGGQPVRPVSLVTPDEAAHAHLVPRPSVKRSVSHHQQRRHMRGAPVVRSGTVVTSGRPPSTKVPMMMPPSTEKSTVIKEVATNTSDNESKLHVARDSKSPPSVPERHQVSKKGQNSITAVTCAATQTDSSIYDYAYSSLPAIPPRVQGRSQSKEENENIYEEIQPRDKERDNDRDKERDRDKDRDKDPDKRLFFSISKGRRENLEMYKFADWDLEDRLRTPKTDKDNYIKPEEIKSSLNKKSSLRKLKTKESRNVTFASDESIEEDDRGSHRQVSRSKSVHVRSESSKL